jgi:hypothetical protein
MFDNDWTQVKKFQNLKRINAIKDCKIQGKIK